MANNALVKQEKKDREMAIVNAAWNSLSPESRKSYQYDYDQFFSVINKDIKQVNPADIMQYIEHLKIEKLKNATINRKIASLSKLFGTYQKAGIIKQNPVDQLKTLHNINFKSSKDIHISLTLQEVKKATKILKSSTHEEKRISIIIKMLAKTGLRISEMINIKHNDILDYSEKSFRIRIIGKGQKERFIFLPKDFYDKIIEIFPVKCDNLFYSIYEKPCNRKTLWLKIRKRFKETTGKDVHPHTLRHWFATTKINVEKRDIKAVSKFLGHSSVQITLDKYVDTALDEKESDIKI